MTSDEYVDLIYRYWPAVLAISVYSLAFGAAGALIDIGDPWGDFALGFAALIVGHLTGTVLLKIAHRREMEAEEPDRDPQRYRVVKW